MTVLGSTPPPPGLPAGHGLVRFAEDLEQLLDDAAEGNAWTMTPAQLQAVLPRLTRLQARLAEVALRVLREADRASVGDDVGATNTPAWWAHATGQQVPVAHGLAKLAEHLDTGHEPPGSRWRAGGSPPTRLGSSWPPSPSCPTISTPD